MYTQITAAERYTIARLRQHGYPIATIARMLGHHRSTLHREVHRNATHHDGGYRAELADAYARTRRSRSRRNQRFSPADWAQVHAQLRELWSPEQIAGRLRHERTLRISHETIYRHV
jgi:transposase, IS30 family